MFEHSFENNLTKKDSFQYFSKVLVRHSLFRPPHSTNIFTYADCKAINEYWIGTFCRFYDQYALCFAPDINEIVETTLAGFTPQEAPQKEGREFSREEFGNKFGELLGVNPAPQAPEKA